MLHVGQMINNELPYLQVTNVWFVLTFTPSTCSFQTIIRYHQLQDLGCTCLCICIHVAYLACICMYMPYLHVNCNDSTCIYMCTHMVDMYAKAIKTCVRLSQGFLINLFQDKDKCK